MTSALRRRAFVLGGKITPFIGKGNPNFISKGHPEFGKKENPTLDWYISEAVHGAFQETGVPAKNVDSSYIGNFTGELFCNQGHLGAAVIGVDSDLRFKPSMRVEGACASGGLAFMSGVRDIQAGLDTVLVSGVEVQTTVSARQGAQYLAAASHFATQSKLDDFVFPCLFARRMKAYRAEFGATEEAIGSIAVKAYENANKNPLAHMHAVKMTQEVASKAGPKNPNFLSNENYKDYLKISDCSQVSDGGAALILVSEEGLRKLGKSPSDAIEVLAASHTTDDLYDEGNHFKMDNTKEAARQVYSAAGITAKDIQVAEVHDCFSIAEILMYEALGFADYGKGWKLAASGETRLDGKIPVNTGGGLIGMGHPVGATGVKQILEVFKQMKGLAGDYQLSKRPEFGLTANMGGNDRTTVCTI